MNAEKTGKFISELRKEKNMTQSELAAQLNITDKAVSKWERGLSYPDTELLPAVSSVLGVTVDELLSGERAQAGIAADTEKTPDPASAVRRRSFSRALPFLYTSAMLLAVIVCLICDFAVSGGLSWSLYPVYSVIFAWAVTIPAVCMGKRGTSRSLAALTLLILPFLYSLDVLVGEDISIMPIGTGAAVISLIYFWLIFFFFRFFKSRKFFAAGISVLTAIPVCAAINLFVSAKLNAAAADIWDIVSYAVLLIISAVLFRKDGDSRAAPENGK